jgi:hypothetical protein
MVRLALVLPGKYIVNLLRLHCDDLVALQSLMNCHCLVGGGGGGKNKVY